MSLGAPERTPAAHPVRRAYRMFSLIIGLAAATAIGMAVSSLRAESADAPAAGDGPAATAGESPADPARPPDPVFDIAAYDIIGNTLLEPAQIERAVYSHLGPRKTLADVERAQKALQQVYHTAGYSTVIVDIPEQQVTGGVVQLRVTEGRLARLSVRGTRYFSPARIRARVPELAAGKVPHLPTVQAQLAQLGRSNSDRSVTPILRPGKAPGTVDVELRVQDRLPLHGEVEYNNRYTTGTTHRRLSGSLRYDNLWQREHSLAVQYQVSPRNVDEVSVLSGTYLMRSSTDAARAYLFYAVHSESDVATVANANVIGKGDILGFRLVWPLAETTETSDTLLAGLDYKDFKETITLGGADDLSTPISYMPFTVQYIGNRRSERRSTRFGASMHFSVRGLADETIDCENQPVNEFDCKRVHARPNFFYVRGQVEHVYKWQNGMSFTAKAETQLSDSILISNEQFSAGGAESVRGYTEAQQLGDYGAQGSLELSTRTFAPNMYVRELRFRTFVDGATLRLNDVQSEQVSRFDFLGAGVGAHWMLRDSVHGSVDWARALKDVGTVRSGDKRLHFKLEYRF